MKRVLVLILLTAFMFGCSKKYDQMGHALDLRSRLLNAEECSFDVEITADYGDKIHTFEMSCISNSSGDLTFRVTKPDSISGISGSITPDNGQLTFDNQILSFSTIAEGQITPVSAPWVFINTLKNGFIRACGEQEEGFWVQIDDSYRDDALALDIWINDKDQPIAADILWDGRRILSLRITNFVLL